MILHSQILHQCLVSDSGQMQRARSFYADERVSDELRSFIDGTIPVVDLIGSPEEGAIRSIFCWLWSGTYPRKVFLELVTQRPQWRWCSLGRDLMLPPEAEVSLKVFEDKSAVWGLLLLLSSSIPGVDLAPLCALFKEEANIPWYVRTTLQRLMKVREELEQSAAMDFDSSINIMTDDDFSEAIFLLASLDYEAVRHTSSLYLSYYIERVWNVTKAVNVVPKGSKEKRHFHTVYGINVSMATKCR
jgi:hypothetical protein